MCIDIVEIWLIFTKLGMCIDIVEIWFGIAIKWRADNFIHFWQS